MHTGLIYFQFKSKRNNGNEYKINTHTHTPNKPNMSVRYIYWHLCNNNKNIIKGINKIREKY